MLRENLRPIYVRAWRALARTPAKKLLPGWADLVAVVNGFFGDTPAPQYLGWAFTRPTSPYTRAVIRAGGWVAACELVRGELTERERDLAWGAIPILSLLGILHEGLEGPIHARSPGGVESPRPHRSTLDEFRPPPVPGDPMLRASFPVGVDAKKLRFRFAGTEVPAERVAVATFHTEHCSADLAHAVIEVPEPWEEHYQAFYMLPGEQALRPISERVFIARHNDFRVVLRFDEDCPVLPPSHSGIQHTIKIELYGAQNAAGVV